MTSAHMAAYAGALLPGTGGICINKSYTHIDARKVKSRL